MVSAKPSQVITDRGEQINSFNFKSPANFSTIKTIWND